jgi:hypothetical protein
MKSPLSDGWRIRSSSCRLALPMLRPSSRLPARRRLFLHHHNHETMTDTGVDLQGEHFGDNSTSGETRRRE